VLLLHFSLTYRLTDSPLSLVLPVKWIRAVVVNGNYGVTLFFVISGFLITSNNLAVRHEAGAILCMALFQDHPSADSGPDRHRDAGSDESALVRRQRRP
jgi:surface polysaccharide O-acyltransferase-like enzyme